MDALPANRILINTSRGAVVDNTALLRIVEDGKLLRVVLDVWEVEKPEVFLLPLLACIDIGTAHIAGYTLEGKARGIAQIFRAYAYFLGIDERADLEVLLPAPAIEGIRLRGVVDEEMLRLLVHLVYDVRRDDMLLRRVAGTPGAFLHLRKNYYKRREWSSVCIDTDNKVAAEMLMKFGF